jgi:hypothetical protein
MMLLGILGGMMVTLSSTEISIAANFRDGIAAQSLAEEGIRLAIVKVQHNTDFLTTITNLKVPPDSNNTYIINSITKNPGMTTAGSYSVTVKRLDNSNDRIITAAANVNKAKRQIIIKVTLPVSSSPAPLVISSWNNH